MYRPYRAADVESEPRTSRSAYRRMSAGRSVAVRKGTYRFMRILCLCRRASVIRKTTPTRQPDIPSFKTQDRKLTTFPDSSHRRARPDPYTSRTTARRPVRPEWPNR